MERKMATIQKIRDIRPIEGADKIELATVNSWNVVVAKDVGHSIGDWIVYCEIDSFLPIKPEFEFLRKTSFKRMGDTEGFRLKTIRMRGQFSQGLILPIKVLEGPDEYKLGISHQPHGDVYQIGPYDDALIIAEGVDVSELLGIVKYEPPIPASLAGVMKGNFPSFLRKTDEERIQNLTDEYEEFKKMNTKWYSTEKLDGSSSSFYNRIKEFGVCSRNIELARPEPFVEEDVVGNDGKVRKTTENTFWKVARENGIEERLSTFEDFNISVQGELIGEGVQKNMYNLKGHSVRMFNLFDIDNQKWVEFEEFERLCDYFDFETVPVLDRDFQLPDTIEELIEIADGKSVLNKDRWREGIVIRSYDRNVSFKVISNKFLSRSKD